MKMRHHNIVKLYFFFCSHEQFKFLVYDYIERGSLATILCHDELANEFNWQRRVSLINDVARGIYITCIMIDPPIIHHDITSGNILVDAEYKAFVPDFGTARVTKPDSSNWTELAGTYGYLAPKHSYNPAATEKCDLYSFGVVIMEVVMGKHPGDLIGHLSSFEELDALLEDIIGKRPATLTKNAELDIIQLITDCQMLCASFTETQAQNAAGVSSSY
ncbi:hypothetical protein ACP70R_014938 [Stipagrostis hirtigluma subsp. patula]